MISYLQLWIAAIMWCLAIIVIHVWRKKPDPAAAEKMVNVMCFAVCVIVVSLIYQKVVPWLD